MPPDDQTAVIRLLETPSTHGGAVERIDTHASIVFLAGASAWKLKRAVRYDYLDFSTADRRRALCERELEINRRTAPGIYRRVVPVTREADGTLALDGAGAPVDWLIEMRRFDGSGLFDRLAENGALPLELMAPLASSIARLHASADRRRDHGGRQGMAWVIDGNAAAFEAQGVVDAAVARRLTHAATAALECQAALLETRRDQGFVRQCHGDLHLRNIVLLEGAPTLFDAVEFSDEIACIDVMYDLAFLLMDLWRRRLPGHANAVLNAYLRDTGDVGALALLPLFLSCRAAIRAKTSASAAALADDDGRRRDIGRLSREYLEMAAALLEAPGPSLVAIGGLSGSGKSTVARALAPDIGRVPGAVVIRSDEVRKHLCGVAAGTRLGPEAYTAATSARVYAVAAEQATAVVATGQSAIVDAVFARPCDREAIERVAATARVPFAGLWLDVPPALLVERVQARVSDASDADLAVVREQLAADAGALDWHRIDGSAAVSAVTAAARAITPAGRPSQNAACDAVRDG